MFNSLLRSKSGATIVEYGLLLALLALVAITSAKTLGTALSTLFGAVAGAI